MQRIEMEKKLLSSYANSNEEKRSLLFLKLIETTDTATLSHILATAEGPSNERNEN